MSRTRERRFVVAGAQHRHQVHEHAGVGDAMRGVEAKPLLNADIQARPAREQDDEDDEGLQADHLCVPVSLNASLTSWLHFFVLQF